MSDDKRKNARLQGRFSNDKDQRSQRKEKSKSTKESENKSEKGSAKKDKLQSSAAEGLSLSFNEEAKGSIKELEEAKKPIEIRNAGAHQLSSTDNGISRIIYEPHFISEEEAGELMTILHDSTCWYDKNIVIHGAEVPQPRLVAWYGPFAYTYSGAVLDAAEMPSYVLGIKARVEDNLKKHNLDVVLNSVLLNLYRNEKDSVAWHSDDEMSMGICPTIASLSLGEVRKFEMRPKPHTLEQDPNVEDNVFFVNMKPGSLIIMDGCMQQDWKHRVPKEYHDKAPRINLTFRTVYSIEKTSSEVPLSTPRIPLEPSAPLISANKVVVDANDLHSWPSINDTSSKHSSVSEKADTDRHNHSDESCPTPHDDSSSGISMSDPDNAAISPVPCDASVTQNGSDFTGAPCSDALESSLLEEFTLTSEPVSSSQAAAATKFQFNPNARDFVPMSVNRLNQAQYAFDSMDLMELTFLYKRTQISNEEMERFQEAFNHRLSQAFDSGFFSPRDRFELDILIKINDGSQTENNLAIIMHRICTVVHNAHRRQQEDNYSPGRSYAQRGRMKDFIPRQRNNYSGQYKKH